MDQSCALVGTADPPLDGGTLLHDVRVGVGEPLVEGDGAGVVGVHLVKVPLAGRDPGSVSLEQGLGGGGEAEAARGPPPPSPPSCRTPSGPRSRPCGGELSDRAQQQGAAKRKERKMEDGEGNEG